MPNAWVPNERALVPSATYGASLTNTPISKEFRITAGGARQLVAAIQCSGVTVTSGITAKLQTSAISGVWVDSKTAAIAGNGVVYIKLLADNSSDQTYLPLLSQGRIVLSTGSGDAVTITSVTVLVED